MSLDQLKNILLSPLTVLIGCILGIIVGHSFPQFAQTLTPLKDIFTALLKVAVIPLIFCMISLAVTHFAQTTLFRRALSIFFGLIGLYLFSGVIGVGVALLSNQRNHIDLSRSASLQKSAIQSSSVERDWGAPIEVVPEHPKNLVDWIIAAFPENIFVSLSKEYVLQVVVFSIIFGLSLAFIPQRQKIIFIPILESIESIFEKIFTIVLLFLPFFVFVFLVDRTSHISFDALASMAWFVVGCIIGFLVLFILSLFVLAWNTKVGIFKILRILKDPIFISLATSSSLLAIPSSLEAMKEGFNLDETTNTILLPMGITIAKYGLAVSTAFTCMFAAYIYNIPLSINDIGFIIVMSVIVSLSSIGAPAPIRLAFLFLILDPLGVPFGVLLPLLLVVDVLIDPLQTVVTVSSNCAFTSVFAKK